MPHLALSIIVPQPFTSHFLMSCQSSTNRPVEASLHNRNRQNKNKKQNRVLKREAVLKFQGKLMAGSGLLVQETSCVYKAGTYEKLGVGTWDKGTSVPFWAPKITSSPEARKLAAEVRRHTAAKLFSGPSYYIKRYWLSTSCSKKKRERLTWSFYCRARNKSLECLWWQICCCPAS